MKRYGHIIAFMILSTSLISFADVKLPAIISDNMVLQQNSTVTIWGWAKPEENISLIPGWHPDNVVTTTADKNGNWRIYVKTPKSAGPYTLKIKSENMIELRNILMGEVWLCSGQSNMDMPMQGWDKQPISGGHEDIKNSADKFIRLFKIERVVSDQPINDVNGRWVECAPETVADFSAVGYYFGKEIHNGTGHPVGLIRSTWGGTRAEAWTRMDFIKNNDNLKPILDQYSEAEKNWSKSGTPNKQWLVKNKPASLYNAMISPITNMSIKGVIWYQGEGNAGAAYIYRDLFPTLIKNWRCDFNNYEMPFYFVQLANFTDHKPGLEIPPNRSLPLSPGWAELRETQFMTSALEKTGIAITIDIGETNSIHPGNKRQVGRRLALWALAKDYGKNVEYSGPLYAGYKTDGEKIKIFFKHARTGLVFKDGKGTGFIIASNDRKFVPADAWIENDTIVVSSDQIKEPVAVRYAWAMDPESSLFNKSGLPASPFRTDDWRAKP